MQKDTEDKKAPPQSVMLVFLLAHDHKAGGLGSTLFGCLEVSR